MVGVERVILEAVGGRGGEFELGRVGLLGFLATVEVWGEVVVDRVVGEEGIVAVIELEILIREWELEISDPWSTESILSYLSYDQSLLVDF